MRRQIEYIRKIERLLEVKNIMLSVMGSYIFCTTFIVTEETRLSMLMMGGAITLLFMFSLWLIDDYIIGKILRTLTRDENRRRARRLKETA